MKTAFRPSSGWFEYLLHLRYVFQVHRHHRHQESKTYFCLQGMLSPVWCWGSCFCLALVWKDVASGAASQHLFYGSLDGPHLCYPVQGRSSWLGRGCCALHSPHHPTQLPGRGDRDLQVGCKPLTLIESKSIQGK